MSRAESKPSYVIDRATTASRGASVAAALASPTAVGALSQWRSYLELTKPRLNSLVLVTAAVGYALGSHGMVGASWVVLLHVLVGTALCAAAGAVMNEWLERDVDAVMHRTEDRPIPAGRVSAARALRFGALLAVAGVVYLSVLVNPLAASLAFATFLIYTLVYTPLKRVTSACTLVGAIPGALPPLIGWAAARGSLDPAGWSLFLILFAWQLPHFLAIAWFYRDDYARAGLPMLPVVDPSGIRTSAMMFTWSVLLIPFSVLPFGFRMAGPIYLIAALVLGLTQLALAIRVIRTRETAAARTLFFCTITYLPVLLAVLVVDAIVLPSILSG